MQDGSRGGRLLTDDSGTFALSITCWDFHDSATAAEADGYCQEQLARFMEVPAGAPSRELYEVAPSHGPAAVERSHP